MHMGSDHRPPQRVKISVNGHVKQLGRGSEPVTIGRNKQCDLIVKGKYVSRIHASVEEREDGFYLIDRSINGTYVFQEGGAMVGVAPGDDVRLDGEGLISLGDRVDPANPYLIRFRCE